MRAEFLQTSVDNGRTGLLINSYLHGDIGSHSDLGAMQVETVLLKFRFGKSFAGIVYRLHCEVEAMRVCVRRFLGQSSRHTASCRNFIHVGVSALASSAPMFFCP